MTLYVHEDTQGHEPKCCSKVPRVSLSLHSVNFFLRTHDANEQVNVDTQTQVWFNKYSKGPVKQKFSA